MTDIKNAHKRGGLPGGPTARRDSPAAGRRRQASVWTVVKTLLVLATGAFAPNPGNAATGDLLHRLSDSDLKKDDRFGVSVDTDGQLHVVGAYYTEGTNGEAFAGMARVFDDTGKLVDPLPNPFPKKEDWFGLAVATDNDWVAVGAPGDNNDTSPGEVYVYTYNSSTATVDPHSGAHPLPPLGLSDKAKFGRAVALDGDILVVGAPGYDGDRGRVYVYDLADPSTYLSPTVVDNPSGTSGDWFGLRVAIDGDQIIVGAFRFNNDRGRAYTYTYNNTSKTVTLGPSLEPTGTQVSGDFFGKSVAVEGNTFVVGANHRDSDREGKVYVFDDSGAPPVEIDDPDPGNKNSFGQAVAIDCGIITATSIQYANRQGIAYLFEVDGTPVTPPTDIQESDGVGDARDWFGSSVAMGGGNIIIGAFRQEFYNPVAQQYTGTETGVAYLYEGPECCGCPEVSWSACETDDSSLDVELTVTNSDVSCPIELTKIYEAGGSGQPSTPNWPKTVAAGTSETFTLNYTGSPGDLIAVFSTMGTSGQLVCQDTMAVVPKPCCDDPSSSSHTYGTIDNFIGPEPTNVSASLTSWHSNHYPSGSNPPALPEFDSPADNQAVLHSFTNCDSCEVIGAELTIALKSLDGSPAPPLDSLFLVDNGNTVWGDRIENLITPWPWPNTTIALNLASMPITGTNLLNDYKDGLIDVAVDGFVSVDYMTLDLERCCEDAPVDSFRVEKWNDVNCNGEIDPLDVRMAGWGIEVWNMSGGLEASGTTTGSGIGFNLPAGTYKVTEVPQPGWTPKAPVLGYHTVELDLDAGKTFAFLNCECEPEKKNRVWEGDSLLDLNDPNTTSPSADLLAWWLSNFPPPPPWLGTDEAPEPNIGGHVLVTMNNYLLEESCRVDSAVLTLRVMPQDTDQLALSINDDRVYIVQNDNGNIETIWEFGLMDLAALQNPPKPWQRGVPVDLTLDLGNLPADVGFTDVRAALQDGQLDFAIGNNTILNQAVLTVYECCTSCPHCLPADTLKVHGFKYDDANWNGHYEPGNPEYVLKNWQFELIGPLPLNSTNTVTTVGFGYFEFTSLVPGTYHLMEVAKPGWYQTEPKTPFYEVNLPQDHNKYFWFGNAKCDSTDIINTIIVSGGEPDGFAPTGAEVSSPGNTLKDWHAQEYPNGPGYLDLYDKIPDGQQFLETLEGCNGDSCLVSGATLRIGLQATGEGQLPQVDPTDDRIAFVEENPNGGSPVVIWEQRLDHPDLFSTWTFGSTGTLLLDLGNLPLYQNVVTSILSSLVDGELNIVVGDFTMVDNIDLSVELCCKGGDGPTDEPSIGAYLEVPGSVASGELFQVPLRMDLSGVSSGGNGPRGNEVLLGAFSATVSWDPALLELVDVAAGDLPSLAFDESADGEVRVNAFDPVGAQGLVQLAVLEFRARESGSGVLAAQFDEVVATKLSQFRDLLPLVRSAPAPFEVFALVGDADGSGDVGIRDALIIATFALQPDDPNLPDGLDPAALDVDGNGEVTVRDALIVATMVIEADEPNRRGEPAAKSLPLTLEIAQPGELVRLRVQPEDGTSAYSLDLSWNAGDFTVVSVDPEPQVMREAPGSLALAQFQPGRDLQDLEIVLRADSDGTAIIHSAVEAVAADFSVGGVAIAPVLQPQSFALLANYPNPFNPETTIRYALPRQETVTLTIYNLSGQIVRQLVGEVQPAGRYTVVWGGQDAHGRIVGSGVYLYRLEAGAYSQVQRMLLLK